MIDLIIFDLDGVLLDSESLYKRINFEFFKELGVDITHDEYHSFIGISGEKMWGYIKQKGSLDQTVDELRQEEKERKNLGLKSSALEANDGLFELLNFIKEREIPMGIASSGLKKNIRLILNKLHVDPYFDHIVSGEMPKHGKPAPDIFLLAADHFKVPTEKCLVIEDSTNGVLAAKSAGMKCVGYRNAGSGNQDLSKADFIVDHLFDSRIRTMISN